MEVGEVCHTDDTEVLVLNEQRIRMGKEQPKSIAWDGVVH